MNDLGIGCGTPPLTYHGGPVQHTPRVYLDFWGAKWSKSDPIVTTIENMFDKLAGSAYGNILSQYTDTVGAPNNYVQNKAYLAGVYFDSVTTAPSFLTLANLDYEASVVMRLNAWPDDINTQVMIFPQQGTTYDSSSINPAQECGEHDLASVSTSLPNAYTFSLVMYASDFECNYKGGNNANNMASVASHEFAETATDPVIGYAANPNSGTGWVSSDGYEIGDLCNFTSFTYKPVDGTASAYVQSLWSNADYYAHSEADTSGCVETVGEEYISPDTSFPFHGIHTVQGPILGEYKNVGEAASVIGPPISEEMPMGGGFVSYFTGGCGTNYPKGNCAAIYWSPSSGAYYVRNAEYQEYVAVGQAASVIGFPVSKDTAIGNGGAVTYFNGTCGGTNECAAIYWSPSSGAHYVRNAEFQEYRIRGEAGSVLGFPVTDDTAIGNGGAVTYFNGTCGGTNRCAAIYWSGGSGAHYVRNAEYQEYVAVGQAASVVGFPVTDDTAIGNGGAVTYFNGTCGGTNKCAAIYWSGNTGAQLVRGGDYQLYVTLKEANGVLGFPTTREISTNGGSAQYFTANSSCGTPGPSSSDGAIYWSPSTGSNEVNGCIYKFYQQFTTTNGQSGLNGIFGFPVSNEEGITDYWGDPGRVSYFKGAYCGNGGPNGSGSAIYSWGGEHEVQGCIYAKYQQIGGSNSKLGFPISNEYTNSLGYRESDFSNGEIIWENGTAVVIYQTGCVTTGKCN